MKQAAVSAVKYTLFIGPAVKVNNGLNFSSNNFDRFILRGKFEKV